MKAIITYILYLSIHIVMLGQSTYFQKYHNFGNQYERPLNIIHIEGKNYIWGTILQESIANSYLLITDEQGNQLSLHTYINAFFTHETVLYDEDKERFIAAVRYQDQETGLYGEKILEVDIEGNLTGEHIYEFHDPTAKWEFPYSLVKYDGGYAIAGMIYYEQSASGGLWSLGGIAFLDSEYQKVQSYATDSAYQILENLVVTDEGELYGVLTDYNFPGTPDDGYQWLVSIDKDHFITNQYDLYGELGYDNGNDIVLVYSSVTDAFIYTFKPDDYPVSLACIDKSGQILWAKSQFKNYGLTSEIRNIITLSDGDILITGRGVLAGDFPASFGSSISLSRFDAFGNQKYTKTFFHYKSSTRQYLYTASDLAEDEEGYIYLFGIEAVGGNKRFVPYLVKVDADGNLGEYKGHRQIIGEQYPPEYFLTERNIWHIYNEDTDEHYRYTISDTTSFDGDQFLGYGLLRSDEFYGDSWYETDRYFFSHTNFVHYRYYDSVYNIYRRRPVYFFDYGVGDSWQYEYFTPEDPNKLARIEIIETDSITLQDGRRKKIQRLRCESDPDGSVYGTRTWIQGVGDIDNFSYVLDVCRERRSEKIVCYYGGGELMWTNPEFEGCIVSTEDKDGKDAPSVYPNPATQHLKVSSPIKAYYIYDVHGRQVITHRGLTSEDIDISSLQAGIYLLQIVGEEGYKYTTKFLKE